MKIIAEPVEPCQVRLRLTVTDEFVKRAQSEVARELGRKHKIPGYRPGKAPMARLEAIVGEEVVEREVRDRTIGQAVSAALDREDLTPSAPVSLEEAGGDPLVIVALVPLEPHVELGDYKAIRLDIPEPEPVHEEHVDLTIEAWRKEMAVLTPVDAAAQLGDVMRLSLVGRKDGVIVFDDAALTLHLERGSAPELGVPPDAIDELIGLAPLDEATFMVTYSELWPQPELQGATVEFNAVVEGVSRLKLPEENDELAQQLANVDSMAEFRVKVRAELEARARVQRREDLSERLIDALIATADLRYPPQLLEREITELIQDLRQRVERQGFKWERWLEMQQDNEERIIEEAKERARTRLERSLALSAFVEAEGMRITTEELDKEVREFSKALSPAARRGLPNNRNLRTTLGTRMLTGRAFDRLLAIATGVGDNEQPADVPSASHSVSRDA